MLHIIESIIIKFKDAIFKVLKIINQWNDDIFGGFIYKFGCMVYESQQKIIKISMIWQDWNQIDHDLQNYQVDMRLCLWIMKFRIDSSIMIVICKKKCSVIGFYSAVTPDGALTTLQVRSQNIGICFEYV